MADAIKEKSSYGGVNVDHFSPPIEDGMPVPKALNVHIRFEDALQLHLSLGQSLLGQLNRYNRKTKRGKRTCANLCIYLHRRRITVNEGVLKEKPLVQAHQEEA